MSTQFLILFIFFIFSTPIKSNDDIYYLKFLGGVCTENIFETDAHHIFAQELLDQKINLNSLDNATLRTTINRLADFSIKTAIQLEPKSFYEFVQFDDLSSINSKQIFVNSFNSLSEEKRIKAVNKINQVKKSLFLKLSNDIYRKKYNTNSERWSGLFSSQTKFTSVYESFITQLSWKTSSTGIFVRDMADCVGSGQPYRVGKRILKKLKLDFNFLKAAMTARFR